MVKVNEISINQQTKKAKVSLFADAKSDVTSSMEVIGLPAGVTIDFGSSVMTASGDLAFMKSTGDWNWL